MANTIRLKSGSGNNPSASDLVVGEVALRTDGNPKLFTKNDAGSVLEVGLVESGSIVAGTIVNADINASAAIAGTKINPNFGSQHIQTSGDLRIIGTYPNITLTDSNNDSDFRITNANGSFLIYDITNAATRFTVNSDGHIDIAGNLDVGSGIDVTGTVDVTSGDLNINSGFPRIKLNDTNNNSDFSIYNANGFFRIYDDTNNASRFHIASDGTVVIAQNLDVAAGLDVTGNITVTGTVDGVDIATRDTLFGGLTSSSGVLTNGVTATTQSASDNSTKVATTAYTDTAISNLVNSAPSTLDTLKELSDALGSDPNFATTVTNSIATKLPLAGGTLTGNLTISNNAPRITFTDGNHNDFAIIVDGNDLNIQDTTAGENRLNINSSGVVSCNDGLSVTGALNVTKAGGVLQTIEATDSNQSYLKFINSTTGNGTFTDGLLVGLDTDETAAFWLYENKNMRFATNGIERLTINADGHIDVVGNLDVGAGIDVTGNITVTGTVDGRDLAADGSKLDTYEANGSSYLRSDAVDSSSANITINGLEVGSWALGAAYRGIFHTSQSGGEYMMISQDEDTFISATTGHSVYIRSGGNDATNQLVVGSGNDALTWRGNKIFHAGNDGAGSGLDADTLDGYTSGQFLRADTNHTASGQITLTSSTQYPLKINSTADGKIVLQGSNSPFIMWKEGGTDKAFIQWSTNGNFYFANSESGEQLYVGNSGIGLKFVHDGTTSTVWHAGNDGSGSGLDADTLDGVQASGLVAVGGDTMTGGLRIDKGNSADGIMGEAYSGYFGLKHSDQTYNSEYMILSQDSHTYISASDGSSVYIRGGGNATTNQMIVSASGTTIGGNLVLTSASSLNAANLTGTLPALDGSNLTGLTVNNAQTLDNIDSTQFLRSDANDTASGLIQLTNGAQYPLDINGANDGKLLLRGSTHPYIMFREGNTDKAYIQWNGSGWLQLSNYEDESGIRIKDDIVFTQNNFGSSHKIWHQANDGSGSGLDSDTVDGIQGGSFLRGDVDDTTVAHLTFNRSIDAKFSLSGSNNPFFVLNEGTTQKARFQWSESGYVWIQNHEDNSVIVLRDNFGFSPDAGSTIHSIWHAGNDGSGSGLDSDTLDGVQGSSYLRSDADDTMSANLTIDNGTSTTLSVKCDNAGLALIRANGDGQGTGAVEVGQADTYGGGIAYNGDGSPSFASGETADHIIFYRLDNGTRTEVFHYPYNSNTVNFNARPTIGGVDIVKSTDTIAQATNASTLDNIDSGSFARSDASDTLSGDYTFTGGAGAITITSSDIRSNGSSDWTGNPGLDVGKIQMHSNRWYIVANGNSNRIVQFRVNGDDKTWIANDGQIYHGSSGTGDKYWRQGNDGSGSGLDADNLDGRTWSESASNSTIVSRNANGYVFANFFNTTANDTGTGADVTRFYCSEDQYIRYIDKASMRSVMNVSARSSAFGGRETQTTNTDYWIGSAGWGANNFDTTVWDYGSCFFDVWSNPSGQPSGTSHWQGVQAMHYTNGSARYGMRITMGAGQPSLAYIQGRWNTTTYGWHKLWNAANDGSGSGLDSDTVDGIQASSFLRSDANDNLGGVLSYTSNDARLQFTNSSYSKSLYIGGWSSTNSNGISRIRNSSDNLHIDCGAQGALYLNYYSTKQTYVASLWPRSNNTYDLGTSSNRWRNLYINDLNLSNEGSTNDVDGTWGSYTIQEGAEELYLINKRNGKKYKFNLTEVS